MSKVTFQLILWVWMALAILIFPLLLKVPAPYGRHTRKGWGPVIPNRLGWIIMELPSPVLYGFFFWYGPNDQYPITILFFLLFSLHYLNRSLIFPFRTQTSHKKIPLIIVVFAILFNLANGSLNGYYFGFIAGEYGMDWLTDPRFIAGGMLFFCGAYINIRSDHILLSLRSKNRRDYDIPQGGLFRYVSCPNFLGEIIEWTGFALMTWSPAAFVFVIWTVINLVPRALDHHRWYHEKFSDYPSERKALIPYLL